VLYKQGPPFYHASYIVLVEVIDKSTMTRIPEIQRNMSWTRLMGLNRVGETAGKVSSYI
jgi:tRNA-splicing endonuclease subunit Sen2